MPDNSFFRIYFFVFMKFGACDTYDHGRSVYFERFHSVFLFQYPEPLIQGFSLRLLLDILFKQLVKIHICKIVGSVLLPKIINVCSKLIWSERSDDIGYIFFYCQFFCSRKQVSMGSVVFFMDIHGHKDEGISVRVICLLVCSRVSCNRIPTRERINITVPIHLVERKRGGNNRFLWFF